MNFHNQFLNSKGIFFEIFNYLASGPVTLNSLEVYFSLFCGHKPGDIFETIVTHILSLSLSLNHRNCSAIIYTAKRFEPKESYHSHSKFHSRIDSNRNGVDYVND